QVPQPQEPLTGGDDVLDRGQGRALAVTAHHDVLRRQIGGAPARDGDLHGLRRPPEHGQDRVEGDRDPWMVPRGSAGQGAGQRGDGGGRCGGGEGGEVLVDHQLHGGDPARVAARI